MAAVGLVASVGAGLVCVLLAGSSRADAPPPPPGAVCAEGATVAGIDVSRWQGDVDWDQVAGQGVRFAFIRVSDGLSVVDEKFAEHWRGAKQAGVMRGAYQFFRANEDAQAQADLLLETMGPLDRGDLPPVLDIEVAGDVERDELLRRLSVWVLRVKDATGQHPIIYLNARGWHDIAAGDRRFRFLPLWVAHYDVECPATPRPWTRWTFHQMSDHGRVDGISGDVDLNRFNGNARALRALTVRDAKASQKAWKAWRAHRQARSGR